MARLILHFLMLMKFNTHAITEAVLASRARPSLVTVISVGTGLYPSLCLVNASCDHNVAHYNLGTRVVAVAARDIQEGEEVTDNYFPSYMVTGRAERRAWLEDHYWYTCRCCACTEDTPTMAAMPPHPDTFPCAAPGCPGQLARDAACPHCGAALDMDTRSRCLTRPPPPPPPPGS